MSGKATSGSGNDGASQSAESGSEGSSDGSEENGNHQEYGANKKGSFDKMLADGANAQNNTALVPGKPVVSVPATSLNMGMDLWNASPAGAGTAKMRGNQFGAPSAVGGDHWIQGALDGGLDIPHSNKRFAGFSKDNKQLDAEVHRKYIYGGHVAAYMRISLNAVTSITDGLKKLYIEKLKPLEAAYRFNDFGNPLLVSILSCSNVI
ncbi:putative EH domain-containing protein [Rosa chinensis]|uniref:Putative EH domain-containing protein n=1 Tax=Rosa chinensis TaxID=74649 RepID=A0A2P6Q1M3_ROSCH|nr:putative EH domain-containing protein [Rosa chinensis]